EPMNLVYEQHVAFLQVRKKRCEVASFFYDRTCCRTQFGLHLVCDDVGERGLAESGRTCQKNVVERLVAIERGLDEDAQVIGSLALAYVLGKSRWPERQ